MTARSDRPGLDERPLVWSDLKKDERRDTAAAVSGLYENARDNFYGMAESLRNAKHPTIISRRSRYGEASYTVPEAPVSLRQATDRRVSAVERAATVNRKDTESIAGAGWYFDHRREAESAVAGTEIDSQRAMDAASRLSPRAQPEQEKASLRGLAQAHQNGLVTFHPDVVDALGNVPRELHGRTIPFASVPSDIVAGMSRSGVRERVEPHTSGVDLAAISQVSLDKNIKAAHEVLQSGASAPSPHKNPKMWSYSDSHRDAIPDSPEEGEYRLRAADLGAKIRGEEMRGQQMLDYYGKRSSNEGILSNEGHTAEDSWMNSVSSGVKGTDAKVMGDLTLTRKGDIGAGDTRITPGGLQHAWNHEATTRAASRLERKYDTEYTVPSRLVQEAAWYTARREAPKRANAVSASADTDWNEYNTERSTVVKDAEKQAHKENAARSKNLSKQMEMF
jgi:hypothetical protein